MNRLEKEKIVVRLQHLASLPDVVMQLLKSFACEDIEVEEIARQISHDQALSARVLRVANSSFFGLQNKVATIQEAVVVLGFRAVRSMVLAIGMGGAFRTDQCKGFNAGAQQRHSIGTSMVAWHLSDMAGCNRDLAFTAGLLHDVGQLALASNFSVEYAETIAFQRKHDLFITDAEREILGTDHAEVGGLLAEIWHFPEPLRQAVADHHDPVRAGAESLANLMHVADVTAHALGFSQAVEEKVMPLNPVAWKRINGDWDVVRKALPAIEQGFGEACRILLP